jgi:hypothetical protein
MITTFLRSSSYNTWDFCQTRYFLEYVLHLKQPSNKAAEKGNVLHKALELFALENIAKKNNQTYIQDPELGKMKIGLDVKKVVKKCYDNNVANSPHQYFITDYEDCLEWTEKVLNYKGGIVDPRTLDIISAEQSFDIEIKEDWAKYTFTLPNKEIWAGYLSVKGNIDLITKVDDNTIEFIDWKSGKRVNWNTGQEKDEEALKKDPQLLLYYYALRSLYPDKQVMLSIYFINYGGIYSIYFDDSDLEKAKGLIRNRFEEIVRTKNPRRIREKWQCQKFCHFRKGNDICEQIHQDIERKGIDYALEKHNTGYEKINTYGSGGGKSASN